MRIERAEVQCSSDYALVQVRCRCLSGLGEGQRQRTAGQPASRTFLRGCVIRAGRPSELTVLIMLRCMPPKRTGHIRGFTMIEMISVLVVIGILTTVAAFATLKGRSTTTTNLGQRTLTQVAAAQEEHFRQRGAWLTGSATGAGFGDVGLTTSASVSAESVSYSIDTTPDGYSTVGLALLTDDGICMTLRLPEPGRGQEITDNFITSEERICRGDQA
jgi:prepilin-type N-terminal cleavage/methylation domain-containing protein